MAMSRGEEQVRVAVGVPRVVLGVVLAVVGALLAAVGPVGAAAGGAATHESFSAPPVTAPPAGPAPMQFSATGCYSDVEGDVQLGLNGDPTDVPQADIVEWCVAYGSESLDLTVTVAEPTDPITDPNWDGFSSAVIMFFSDRQGESRTLNLGKGRTDDRFEYYVFDNNNRSACDGVATFEDGTYQASVPQSCVSAPTNLTATVSMFYGRDADGSFEASPRDNAPDSGRITIPRGAIAQSQADRIPRLFGPERITTAIEVSRASFQDGAADEVVLASSETFPDALVAAPLASAVNGPVLLTPFELLPEIVLDEIERVAGPSAPIRLMGGTLAVSQAVEDALLESGHAVTRVAGDNRFETSVVAAESANADPTNILLAFGGEFTGALVSGAASTTLDATVVLIDRGGIPQVVQDYIDRHPDSVVSPVGDIAIAAAPDFASRVSGATGSAVSVEMAKTFPEFDQVMMASSEAFPDGLSGGAYAAALRVPLLLSPRDSMEQGVLQYLLDSGPLTTITFFGGDAALSDTVAAQAAQALADEEPE